MNPHVGVGVLRVLRLPGVERAVVGRGLPRQERELLAVVGVLRLQRGRLLAARARLVSRDAHTCGANHAVNTFNVCTYRIRTSRYVYTITPKHKSL